MGNRSLIVRYFVLILLATFTTHARADVDWAERASSAKWSWPDREPSLFASTMMDKKIYQVKLEHIHGHKFLVHITRNDKVCLKFEAHAGTPFRFRDQKIIYAKFNPTTSGCTVVAFDLAASKQLWEVRLSGIGDIEHSFYSNRVSLDLNGNAVEILGWEDGGKYLEYLDIETGRRLGHKAFH